MDGRLLWDNYNTGWNMPTDISNKGVQSCRYFGHVRKFGSFLGTTSSPIEPMYDNVWILWCLISSLFERFTHIACFNRSHRRFLAIADFKSQLCHDDMRCEVKHIASLKVFWSTLKLLARLQRLECLIFFLLFKNFTFYYHLAQTPNSQSLLL